MKEKIDNVYLHTYAVVTRIGKKTSKKNRLKLFQQEQLRVGKGVIKIKEQK